MKKLPWIDALSAHIGLREIKGAKHEPVIVGWLNAMGGYTGEEKVSWRDDETAWCLAGDIEVLTSEGFVRLDEMSVKQPAQVAQLNPDTLAVEFVSDYGVIEKEYLGNVYEFRDVGILCDPNHRLFGKYTTNAPYRLRPAHELTKYGCAVPNIHSSESGHECDDTDLMFMAAFLSDGTAQHQQIKFHVSKERKMSILDTFPNRVLKRVEPKVYGISNHQCTTYAFPKTMLREDWLEKYKLLTWDFVKGLSQQQAKVFIDTYTQFDGTTNADTGAREVFTADPALQEQLAYIATMAGYKVTPYAVKQVNPLSKIEYLYHVYIGVRKHRAIRRQNMVEQSFDGMLYCLSVPSQVMIIRTRYGIIMPIGNCGLAVGHALGSTGRYVVKQWYRARAWADPDKMTELEKPAYGCIVVFSRQGGGHVGFVVGKDKVGRLMVLGGNQGDAVNVKPFGLDRVLGYYWPSSWIGGECVKATPDPERYDLPLLNANGVPSSTNEA